MFRLSLLLLSMGILRFCIETLQFSSSSMINFHVVYWRINIDKIFWSSNKSLCCWVDFFVDDVLTSSVSMYKMFLYGYYIYF